MAEPESGESRRDPCPDTGCPKHLSEVATRRQALIAKTRAAVHDRLTKEISYWDRQATELKAKEEAGKRTRLPAYEARRRADELAARLDKRLKELDQEAQLSPKLPLVRSGIMVVPQGLVDTMNQRPTQKLP